jgi:hypothetical protein
MARRRLRRLAGRAGQLRVDGWHPTITLYLAPLRHLPAKNRARNPLPASIGLAFAQKPNASA